MLISIRRNSLRASNLYDINSPKYVYDFALYTLYCAFYTLCFCILILGRVKSQAQQTTSQGGSYLNIGQ